MYNKKFLIALTISGTIFSGCGDKEETTTTQQTKAVEQKVVTQTQKEPEVKKETVDKVAQTVITQVESTAKKVEQVAKDIQTSAAPAINSAAQKIKEVQKTVANTSMEDVTKKINEVATPMINSVKEATSSPDGAKLYGKCIGCHGQTAQNAALGKSKVIKGWEASKIEEALKGYKAGTYGGVMKGLMQSQVSSMSNKEIEAVSKHIASF